MRLPYVVLLFLDSKNAGLLPVPLLFLQHTYRSLVSSSKHITIMTKIVSTSHRVPLLIPSDIMHIYLG
jgi:hypothetical protein